VRFSRFFIDRPVFAVVLSLVVLAAGLISIFALPISEYPEVAPPTIQVHAIYPGANPTVLAQTVGTPLEDAINGVERMLYMSSSATADGALTLTVTFEIGTNVDLAQVQVQNRVAQALARLPEEVRALGVTTEKSSPDITMVVNLVSPDGKYDPVYLRNYAVLNVRNELARLPGAGQVAVFGAGEYAMRVWLDPNRVAARGLSATDVVQAIREQNLQVAAGVVGAQPMPDAVAYQLTVSAQGRLVDEVEFGNIIIKSGTNGEITRLRDVARIELSAGNFGLRALLDNKSAVAIGMFQAPGSNALALASSVRAKMAELSTRFPQGMTWTSVYDPTIFVRDSIKEVVRTLLEATLMVVIVVVLFLQTWRASIIPLAAVPISIVGTFAVMLAAGFSINTLSLFGLVLAIGIVVDDAIVVVENVERHIEEGLTPLDASHRAMEEVSGPIIAIALVLCAVFVPVAFISGLTGQFYRQFALTIAFSTLISAFNSLTLSPALAALLLKPRGAPADAPTRALDRAFGWLFRPFNRAFVSASHRYGNVVGRVTRRSAIALVVYGGLIVLSVIGFARVPAGFVPSQDKQYLVAIAQLPDVEAGARAAGCRQRDRFPRSVDHRLREQAERRCHLPPAQTVRRAKGPRSVERRDPDGAQPEVRHDPGGVRGGIPAARRERPWSSGRLQDAARGPGGARRLGTLRRDAGVGGGNVQVAAARRILLGVPGQRAATLRRRRSRQGEAARHSPERSVPDAADLSRLGLRERLQQVRAHVPGDRPGRRAVPGLGREHRPVQSA
jgi:multidrug efflux pump